MRPIFLETVELHQKHNQLSIRFLAWNTIRISLAYKAIDKKKRNRQTGITDGPCAPPLRVAGDDRKGKHPLGQVFNAIFLYAQNRLTMAFKPCPSDGVRN